MESSIATFLMRWSACELLPTNELEDWTSREKAARIQTDDIAPYFKSARTVHLFTCGP